MESMSPMVPTELKPSNKKVYIVIGATIIFIIALVVGISVARYSSAKDKFNKIVVLMEQNKYREAYSDFTEYKSVNKYKSIDSLIDEKLKELQDISNGKYSAGVSEYKNDDETFSKTKDYYSNYASVFSYDTVNVENSNNIVKSIEDYNEALEAFNDVDDLREYVDANSDFIIYLVDCIEDVDELYDLAYEAINNSSNSGYYTLLTIWNREKSTYYDLLDDLDESQEAVAADLTIFTKSDFDYISEYITRCLLPCEFIYNYVNGVDYDDDDFETVRENWTIHDRMNRDITNIMNEYIDIIINYDSEYEAVSKELETRRDALEGNFSNISVSDDKIVI